MDERVRRLAEVLVHYSTKVENGEYVMINGDTEAEQLLKELYRLVLKNGAYPIMKIGFDWQSFIYYNTSSEEQLKHFPEIAFDELKRANVIINVSAGRNTRQLTNIDPRLLSIRQKVLELFKEEQLKKRWVIFDYPSDSLAQEAEMSTEEFEDFVYGACLQDWEEKTKELDKAVNIMNNGKLIRIIGEDTDVSFSNEGRKFIKGDGRHNMPDGEIFTAPVEKSVNGYIKFSYPAIRGGREVSGVRLVFKDGKIVEFSAEKNEDYLSKMVDTDEGSRHLGEVGIGLNYGITKHIKNILFDEKIGGTIHMAIGSAYAECGGVNKSAVHWDIIKDMRRSGKIFVDGKLVYENGEFL